MTGMRLLAPLAALALFPAASGAQSVPFNDRGPTDGLAVPQLSVATADEVFASALNPAGQGWSRGTHFAYLQEIQLSGVGGVNGSGFYLANRVYGPLHSAVSVEWVGRGDPPLPAVDRRKSTVTLAAAGEFASAGFTLNWIDFEEGGFNDFVTVDIGLALRSRWVAGGLVVRDLDGPRFAGPAFSQELPRRWILGLAMRPGIERASLSADILLNEHRGLSRAEVTYGAQLEPIDGIVISATLGHALDAPAVFWAQVGLSLNLHPNTGLHYWQSFDSGPASLTFGARASSERYPAPPFIRSSPPALRVDLDEELSPAAPSTLEALFAGEPTDPYTDALRRLDEIARDPGVKAVVFRTSRGLGVGAARTEELRAAFARLREAGKKILFYLESAGDAEYYLAAAADRIYAAPEALLAINGFQVEATYFGEGLEKLGVGAEFVRVGAYKNAPDRYTREDMSDEEREALSALLDDMYGRYVAAVAEARKVAPEKVREALDHGVVSPQEAAAAGLIDGVAYPDEIEEKLKELAGETKVGRAPSGPERRRAWAPPPRIALVRIEGTIAAGKSQRDPFGLAETAGAETVGQALRSAAEDDSIAAIVVRVDSGGGDAAASDLIWREIFRARKKKPVIASLGDVAASGGYYVAMGADAIVAEPSTVTGSIGVFAGKFDLGGLYRKLGISVETLVRGKSADLFSLSRGFTDEERARLQKLMDEFYGRFIDRVAEGRKLSRELVEGYAQGRVWSGRAAEERRLVDKLGGLETAVQLARERAGLLPDEEHELVYVTGERADENLDLVPGALKSLLRLAAPALKLVRAAEGAPMMLLPYELAIE